MFYSKNCDVFSDVVDGFYRCQGSFLTGDGAADYGSVPIDYSYKTFFSGFSISEVVILSKFFSNFCSSV
ncbi:MAG: hypothetical protein ACKO96_29590, partial [Flammeovirgaceae bacterium]